MGDRRDFLRRMALWGGLSAVLVGGGGFALKDCGGETQPSDDIEWEDCDADDLAEGDSDCGPTTPRRTGTRQPASTAKTAKTNK